MPVYLEGNVIDLGVYKLQVAEACSGLRYLFPIMSFTYVFAVLYRGPVWHKLVLLLSAVPLAVLMNSFRIGVIGILVDRHGIAEAEGFLHVFEGWVIFLACIAILFGMAKAMQWLSRRPAAARRGARPRLLRPRRRSSAGCAASGPRRALIAVALLTAALSLAFALAPERGAARRSARPSRCSRVRLGDGAGPGRRSGSSTPSIEAVLGADDYLAAGLCQPGRAGGRSTCS